MNDLISLIEGAAPTIAAALVPGPLSAPVGALAGVAIAHLADGLGLPHPATSDDIVNALSGVSKPVQDAVLSRAESNFKVTLAPVTPAVGSAAAPATDSTPAEPDISTNHGVTLDLPSILVFALLSALSGGLASKGISLNGFAQAITGSPDLHVAAAMLAGTLTVLWRQVRGSNKNTVALASSSKS